MISTSIAGSQGSVCELQLIGWSRCLSHIFSNLQRDSMLSSFQVESLFLRSYIEWPRGSQMYHSLNNGLVSPKSKNGTSLVYRGVYVQKSMSWFWIFISYSSQMSLCLFWHPGEDTYCVMPIIHMTMFCRGQLSFSLWPAAASQEGTEKSQERPRLIYRALLCGGLEGCQSPRRLLFCDARHIGRKLGSGFKASCI